MGIEQRLDRVRGRALLEGMNNELAIRVERLEERLAWYERHAVEQDKVMMELGAELGRVRKELVVLRERSQNAAEAGGARAAEERPPHY